MTKEEKIAMLEEIMDVEEGSIDEETVLDDIEEWDSLSILTLITEMKKKFNINLTSKDINDFASVKDICNIIP